MDLFEEIRDLELNEDLPKDLAKAFRTSFAVPREGSRYTPGNYGNITYMPDIDFKNSTYTEISPEEALKLYKAGQSRNVLCLFNGQLANTYLDITSEGSKRQYDFKAEYRGGDKAPFTKDNGKVGNNTMWLSPKEFYNNANKIYLANEVNVDPNLRAERRKNPESKYVNPSYNKPLPKPMRKGGANIQTDVIDFKGDTAKFNSTYIQGTYTDGDTGQQYTVGRNDYYPIEVWNTIYKAFLRRWGENDTDTASVKYIIDKLSGKPDKVSPLDYYWKSYDRARRQKADVRYDSVATELQAALNKGRALASRISAKKRDLNSVTSQKNRQTDPAAIAQKKQSLQYDMNYYQRQINQYMKSLLALQDQFDDIDETNNAAIAKFDKQIADIQDELTSLQNEMKGLFSKKESLEEGLEVITLTQEDKASNIRSLIKTCWDNVDAFSLYANQLADFGDFQAAEAANSLINDLYIAIGSFEDALQNVDVKAESIDAQDQVEVVAQVVPQMVPQMQTAPMMIEKLTLEEDDPINEELEEKPEVQKVLEEPIKKELKEVEKVREDHLEDSLNPDDDEDLDEGLETESHLAGLYSSLLKLEG